MHQTVARIDPTAPSLALGDSAELSYDKLLIATGTHVRPFALDGVGPIATLRSKADAEAITARAQTAKSAAIVGGGFIGLELAYSASVRMRVALPHPNCRASIHALMFLTPDPGNGDHPPVAFPIVFLTCDNRQFADPVCQCPGGLAPSHHRRQR